LPDSPWSKEKKEYLGKLTFLRQVVERAPDEKKKYRQGFYEESQKFAVSGIEDAPMQAVPDLVSARVSIGTSFNSKEGYERGDNQCLAART